MIASPETSLTSLRLCTETHRGYQGPGDVETRRLRIAEVRVAEALPRQRPSLRSCRERRPPTAVRYCWCPPGRPRHATHTCAPVCSAAACRATGQRHGHHRRSSGAMVPPKLVGSSGAVVPPGRRTAERARRREAAEAGRRGNLAVAARGPEAAGPRPAPACWRGSRRLGRASWSRSWRHAAPGIQWPGTGAGAVDAPGVGHSMACF